MASEDACVPMASGTLALQSIYMNRLVEIVEQKQRRVAATRELVPIDLLRRRAEGARRDANAHGVRSALLNENRVNIIAEFKRRSPSKGAIKAGADPVAIAREYE